MPTKRHSDVPPPLPISDELLHTIVFTYEGLATLQLSFEALENVFKLHANIPSPNLPFAYETFKRVKQKVADMLLAPGQILPFDGNEVVIMRVSVQLYGIELLRPPMSPERSYRLAICQDLMKLLPDLIGSMPAHD